MNGKQCTILWYVDDNKILHKDEKVVTGHIKILEEYFGKFSITRGKKHNYLGMDVLIKENGKVEINMKEQISKMIDDFSENIEGLTPTPSRTDIYDNGRVEKRSLSPSEAPSSTLEQLQAGIELLDWSPPQRAERRTRCSRCAGPGGRTCATRSSSSTRWTPPLSGARWARRGRA